MFIFFQKKLIETQAIPILISETPHFDQRLSPCSVNTADVFNKLVKF